MEDFKNISDYYEQLEQLRIQRNYQTLHGICQDIDGLVDLFPQMLKNSGVIKYCSIESDDITFGVIKNYIMKLLHFINHNPETDCTLFKDFILEVLQSLYHTAFIADVLLTLVTFIDQQESNNQAIYVLWDAILEHDFSLDIFTLQAILCHESILENPTQLIHLMMRTNGDINQQKLLYQSLYQTLQDHFETGKEENYILVYNHIAHFYVEEVHDMKIIEKDTIFLQSTEDILKKYSLLHNELIDLEEETNNISKIADTFSLIIGSMPHNIMANNMRNLLCKYIEVFKLYNSDETFVCFLLYNIYSQGEKVALESYDSPYHDEDRTYCLKKYQRMIFLHYMKTITFDDILETSLINIILTNLLINDSDVVATTLNILMDILIYIENNEQHKLICDLICKSLESAECKEELGELFSSIEKMINA